MDVQETLDRKCERESVDATHRLRKKEIVACVPLSTLRNPRAVLNSAELASLMGVRHLSTLNAFVATGYLPRADCGFGGPRQTDRRASNRARVGWGKGYEPSYIGWTVGSVVRCYLW